MRGLRLPFIIWITLLLVGCPGGTRAGAPKTAPSTTTSGKLEVTFLDVGQGDSTLIRTPDGTTMLIDGGPSSAGPGVVEALRKRNVSRLDWIIGTHPHEDHIGGLIGVLRAVPVSNALDPGYSHGTATQRTYLTLLRDKKVRTVRARSSQTYNLGEQVKLEVLAPEEPLFSNTRSDPNNNSIVARLVFGSTRFLFTGDMENEERARLLQSHSAGELRAEVLKVAHHGSRNGTDAKFLREVQPKYAVISLARGNDYKHPHKEALEQLQAARVQILRTDLNGTITFRSDGRSLQVTTERTASPEQEAVPGAAAGSSARSSSATPETTTQPVPSPVIGNNSSQVYHLPTCSALPQEARRVRFESAAKAAAAGYRPHAACVNRAK